VGQAAGRTALQAPRTIQKSAATQAAATTMDISEGQCVADLDTLVVNWTTNASK
jgi:hypothetical protein